MINYISNKKHNNTYFDSLYQFTWKYLRRLWSYVNDSVNPYALPVRCQKLMADNFNLSDRIRVPTDVFLIKKYIKYYRKLFHLLLPTIKGDAPLLFCTFIQLQSTCSTFATWYMDIFRYLFPKINCAKDRSSSF